MKKIAKIALLFTIICVDQLYGMEPMGPQKRDLGSFEQLPKELRQEIATTALATSTTVDEAIKAIQNASAIYGGVKLDSTAALDLLVKMLPNDLDNAIKAVKNLQEGSMRQDFKNLQEGRKTLQDFTKLVHALADKFNITTYQVAKKMHYTLILKRYLELGNGLLEAVREKLDSEKLKYIIRLIEDGADVNFSNQDGATPLYFALNKEFNVEIIEILLNHGAKPTNQNLKDFNNLIGYPDDFLIKWWYSNKTTSNFLVDWWYSNEHARKSEIKQLLEEAIKKQQ